VDDVATNVGVIAGLFTSLVVGWLAFRKRDESTTNPPPPPPPPGDDPPVTDPTPPARNIYGVPFAAGAAMPVWPLPADRRSNSATYPGGTMQWARGRVTTDFGDARPFGSASPTRHHVGEDLRAPRGSVLVATERGRIVTIDDTWYTASNGIMTGVVLVATDTGIVLAYGEVEPGSTRALGLNVGSVVERGAPLAQVGATNMVHFETYVADTTATSRWAWRATPPASVLDPTRYLERAAKTVPA
jgi:murein DD-endopeptidase MepM/ murein hydrolase activator NlpD